MSEANVANVNWDDAIATLTAPGARFEIVDSEIRGVALKVFKNTPPSLRAAFQIARTRPDDIFLVYEEERLRFGHVMAAVDDPEGSVAGTLGPLLPHAKPTSIASTSPLPFVSNGLSKLTRPLLPQIKPTSMASVSALPFTLPYPMR